MNTTLIAGIALLMASVSSAEVLVLLKGKPLPENARPSGLKGMRESLIQIDEGREWLNTSKGDINREYMAWRDKKGRFTIGWDLEEGRVESVYYYKGGPEWERGKMVPVKWPRCGSISIDLQSGQLLKKKPAEQDGAGQAPTAPESK